MMKLHIIFQSQDAPDGGPQQQVFVEVHDEDGNSINAGEWSADGEYEQLTIDTDNFPYVARFAI